MGITIKEVLPAIGTLDRGKPETVSEGLTADQVTSLELWAGLPFRDIEALLSPKRNKALLKAQENKSGTVNIIFHRMKPEEQPRISFSVEQTVYGQVIIASTAIGVCYLVFYNGKAERAQGVVEKHFQGMEVTAGSDVFQQDALGYIQGDNTKVVHLHVKGTEEQLKIWEELTKVPEGMVTSYGALGKATECMAQDVGMAMGDNRIALLVPCHRVIKSTGEIGQYHYGARLKRAIILREAKKGGRGEGSIAHK